MKRLLQHLWLTQSGNRSLLATAGVLLALTGATLAGCEKKAPDAPTVAPASLKGQAPVVPTGEVKGTPEQEAVKQHAIEQGPAIEAALKAQQEAQPAPK